MIWKSVLEMIMVSAENYTLSIMMGIMRIYVSVTLASLCILGKVLREKLFWHSSLWIVGWRKPQGLPKQYGYCSWLPTRTRGKTTYHRSRHHTMWLLNMEKSSWGWSGSFLLSGQHSQCWKIVYLEVSGCQVSFRCFFFFPFYWPTLVMG